MVNCVWNTHVCPDCFVPFDSTFRFSRIHVVPFGVADPFAIPHSSHAKFASLVVKVLWNVITLVATDGYVASIALLNLLAPCRSVWFAAYAVLVLLFPTLVQQVAFTKKVGEPLLIIAAAMKSRPFSSSAII